MKTNGERSAADVVAGNGLLHRRALLGRGLVLAGAIGAGIGASTGAAAEPLTEPDWSLVPGDPMPAYQVRSSFEKNVVRLIDNPNSQPQISHARTPHHLLNGIITPNGLHFNVNHGGVPPIDPSQHKLLIHGLVKRPLVFSVEALLRYPMVSRINFVECGGNSAPLYNKDPVQANVQAIHGLVSCSQWTGVRLSTLLEETGIEPKAKWLLAEGADGPSMNRSIPEFRSKSVSRVLMSGNSEMALAVFSAMVEVPTPALEGRKENT